MKFGLFIVVAMLVGKVSCAYVPPEPWHTLIPGGVYEDGTVDYSTAFGIAVVPVVDKNYNKLRRRNVIQIQDGQIQELKGHRNDYFHKTFHRNTPRYVKTVTHVVTQISDGQLQFTHTNARKPRRVEHTRNIKKTHRAEHPTTRHLIPDFPRRRKWINNNWHHEVTTSTTISKYHKERPEILAKDRRHNEPNDIINIAACSYDYTLSMKLINGQLIDSNGRIGSIVSNRQFQFDGPPPQAGTIFANGWSITPSGNLALGSQDIFFRCLASDSFYNLYDSMIDHICESVYLKVVDLIEC